MIVLPEKLCACLSNIIASYSCVYTDVTVSIPAMAGVNEGGIVVEICATLTAIERTERPFIIRLTTVEDTGVDQRCQSSSVRL